MQQSQNQPFPADHTRPVQHHKHLEGITKNTKLTSIQGNHTTLIPNHKSNRHDNHHQNHKTNSSRNHKRPIQTQTKISQGLQQSPNSQSNRNHKHPIRKHTSTRHYNNHKHHQSPTQIRRNPIPNHKHPLEIATIASIKRHQTSDTSYPNFQTNPIEITTTTNISSIHNK